MKKIIFFICILHTQAHAARYTSYQINAHEKPIMTLSLNANGQLLASAALNEPIKLWDLARNKLYATIKIKDACFLECAFDPQDPTKLFAGDSNGKIILIDLTSKTVSVKFTINNTPINTLAINNTGRLLAAGTCDGQLFLWDLKEEKLIKNNKAHTRTIQKIAFSSDNTLMATVDKNNEHSSEIKIWKLSKKKYTRIVTIPTHHATNIAWHPQSTQFAYNIGNNIMIKTLQEKSLWDTLLFKPQQTTSINAMGLHNDWINALDYSIDGAYLCAGSGDKTTTIWQANTQELVARLTHDSPIYCTTWGKDNKKLITGLMNGVITIWEKHEMGVLKKPYCDTSITCFK